MLVGREGDPARRHATRQRALDPLLRAIGEPAEGADLREPHPHEALLGLAVQQPHHLLEAEASVGPRNAGEQDARELGCPGGGLGSGGICTLAVGAGSPDSPASVTQTSQRPQPASVSSSSPK